jgi:hypothetical protein
MRANFLIVLFRSTIIVLGIASAILSMEPEKDDISCSFEQGLYAISEELTGNEAISVNGLTPPKRRKSASVIDESLRKDIVAHRLQHSALFDGAGRQKVNQFVAQLGLLQKQGVLLRADNAIFMTDICKLIEAYEKIDLIATSDYIRTVDRYLMEINKDCTEIFATNIKAKINISESSIEFRQIYCFKLIQQEASYYFSKMKVEHQNQETFIKKSTQAVENQLGIMRMLKLFMQENDSLMKMISLERWGFIEILQRNCTTALSRDFKSTMDSCQSIIEGYEEALPLLQPMTKIEQKVGQTNEQEKVVKKRLSKTASKSRFSQKPGNTDSSSSTEKKTY